MESESGHAPDSRLEKRTGSAFLNIVLDKLIDGFRTQNPKGHFANFGHVLARYAEQLKV